MILFANSPLFLSQDSLLAAPIILDLVILCEVCERIKFKVGDDPEFQSFNPVLSLLSYLLKAPLVPSGTPVVNALFKQRSCIENIFRWADFAPVFHAFNKWHLIFTRITRSQERSLVSRATRDFSYVVRGSCVKLALETLSNLSCRTSKCDPILWYSISHSQKIKYFFFLFVFLFSKMKNMSISACFVTLFYVSYNPGLQS